MLRFQNIRKTYGDLVAVDDVTLEIRPGEVFGLLGPNGAGKTTTVSIAMGLLRPDHGTVELQGHGSPADPSVRARLGIAPQALAIYEELTGDENVAFFGRLYGLHGQTLADRVNWSLDFVALTDRRHDRARTYSGGMKRRLNLAVALVHDPQVLICDEPTVGVDPQSRRAILDKIRELKDLGRTVVYTTHYMEEAERLCDRVGIMDRGRLLALDTVTGLIDAHGGQTNVIVETDEGEQRIATDDALAELARLQQNQNLRRFRVERPDLEAVFLNLTGRSLRD